MNTSEMKAGLGADWAAIAVVIFGVTAFSISQGLTYPLISLVLASREVSAGLIGLNSASFAAGMVLSVLLLGPITRHIKGHRVIVLALLGASFSLAMFASFEALWVWFAARFVLGFSASLIFMMSEAWLNTACPDHIRGRVAGLYGASLCAGFAAGPMAIPIFGTQDGFAFALLAVYVAFIAFASVVMSRKAYTEPPRSASVGFIRFVFVAPVLVGMVRFCRYRRNIRHAGLFHRNGLLAIFCGDERDDHGAADSGGAAIRRRAARQGAAHPGGDRNVDHHRRLLPDPAAA